MKSIRLKSTGHGRRQLPEFLALAAVLAWTIPASLAQTTASTPSDNQEDDEIVELSPFEIVSTQDKGYAATSSLAGSRLNTNLRDVASAITVVTDEFLQDTGSTNLRDVLVYTTSTEVSGVGGNFYGGNADDNAYRNQMLANPQSGTRVRGLNTADLTRNFFVTSIPMDAYNTSRIDIQRGPNSILFGLGSPAGIINNTLKDPNLHKFDGEAQFRVGSYGSHREVLDVNVPLIKGQLGLRIAGVNDEAQYRQDFSFNHDKRLYGAVRWQPKLARSIFTQVDIKGEKGRIRGNRPVPITSADFISNWFGPLNKYLMYDPLTSNGIPQEPNGTQHPELSHYFAGAPGRDWWNSSPATIYQNAATSAIGNGRLDAYRQRDGSPWGGLSGVTNPNYDEGGTGPWNRNTAAFFASNPIISDLIKNYESTAGRTFRGFGAALWPTQMILGGPLAFDDRIMAGPNKGEWNDFDNIDVSITQTYFDGRLGLNAAYYRENYESGFANTINSNRVSVDVNATLRDNSSNPDVGRPYIVSSSAGRIATEDRESWRVTGYYKFDLADHLGRDHLLSRIFGEQTFTGIVSSQKYENFSRDFNLYAWDAATYGVPLLGSANHQAWWGLHYIGDNLQNVPNFAGIPASAIRGVTSDHTPRSPQNALVYDNNTTSWRNASLNLLNWHDHLDDLYTGAAQGHDTTDSTAFVWQGKLLNGALVPLFGWRQDKYERWDKPAALIRDPFNAVLPYSPTWNYSAVTPLKADEQRRSWGAVLHTNELLELFGAPRLPRGLGLSFTYNDSNSFRPSEVGRDINGEQFPAPSGETKDYGVLITALNDRVSLRVNWFETLQKNTTLNRGPSTFWAKAGIARTMNSLAQEVWGSWSADGTQVAPESLVNKWFFGSTYDTAVANQPLPANWRSQLSTVTGQPLRVRSGAVAGSGNYVAAGTINPTTGLPYLAPPLTADEVEYRRAWFAARSNAEWFRPLDPAWVAAEQFEKITGDDYRIWGESPPAGQKLTNDLVSKGVEVELTANPLPNWRLTLNAAEIKAVRSNILPDWAPFVEANKGLWFEGYNNNPGGPSQLNYWTIDGISDLRHWGGGTTYSSEQDTFGGRMMQDVYGPYVNAISGEGVSVSELRRWRVNFVTNYTFISGALRNVNVGGAVRWQDKTAIGYYPEYNSDANIWVTDVTRPIYGPAETNYDAWIGYEKKLGKKYVWSVQLNVRDLFSEDELIPILANPDGTIAQVRIPSRTTWMLTNSIRF